MAVIMKYLAFFVILVNAVLDSTNAANIDKSRILNTDDSPAISQTDGDETDCTAHDTYKTENWPDDPLKFLAFIEYGEKLTFWVIFKDLEKDVYYDQIVLSHEGITLYKVRNGIMSEHSKNKYLDTAGWTWFKISMKKELILKYWDTTAVNYSVDHKVDYLLVYGSNITVCTDKSPTWHVENNGSRTIPLEPSRQAANPLSKITHVLTLESESSFTPCIEVGEVNKCLTLDGSKMNMVDGSYAITPLLAGRFNLHLEILAASMNIYQKIKGKREEIASFPKGGIKSIGVTSSYSSSSVSLKVFRRRTELSDDSSFPDDKGKSFLKIGQGESITIIALIAIVIVIGIVAILIIHRQKTFQHKQKDINVNIEESHSILPNVENGPDLESTSL